MNVRSVLHQYQPSGIPLSVFRFSRFLLHDFHDFRARFWKSWKSCNTTLIFPKRWRGIVTRGQHMCGKTLTAPNSLWTEFPSGPSFLAQSEVRNLEFHDFHDFGGFGTLHDFHFCSLKIVYAGIKVWNPIRTSVTRDVIILCFLHTAQVSIHFVIP